MADLINTIDLLGDEAVTKALIEKTITEFNDDVLTIIGTYAFCNCTALTSVNMPSVRETKSSCFLGCNALVYVNMPNLYSMTGGSEFKNCTALTAISLPSVDVVSSNAFNGCSSLESVNLPNAIELMNTSFGYCSSLTVLDLPKCTEIGRMCFNQSCAFKTIILRSETVCALTYVNAFTSTQFSTGYAGGTLLVPRALVTDYQNATNWSSILSQNANNRFLALEDYTVDGTITGEIDWDKLNGGN